MAQEQGKVWQKELLKKYPQLKMEILKEGPTNPIEALQTMLGGGKSVDMSKEKYAIVVPTTPNAKTQKAIRAMVPEEIELRYVEAPKQQTLENIKFICQQQSIVSANSKTDEEKRHLTIWLVVPEAEETSEFWSLISTALYEDGFFNSWEIIVNEGVSNGGAKMKRYFNRKVMDETATRKVGIEPITDESIMDLQIALQTTNDVNDFLALIEGRKK